MKALVRTVLFILVVYNVLRFLISFLGEESFDYIYVEAACQEETVVDPLTNNRAHLREWTIPEVAKSHCISYRTFEETSAMGAQNREALSVIWPDNFWGGIYRQLVDQADGQLDYLVDSLRQVAAEQNYSSLDLAKLTVSFVQDIPYSFVLPIDCAEYRTDGQPCLGNVPYGIISPYEFLHTLYGDCDTRAVLLYVLLQKMDFDPMIVVSNEYAHAMLALNIPAQGEYLRHNGKKYYFWETTAKGWSIGMLPPDTNNKNYWKVALVNES